MNVGRSSDSTCDSCALVPDHESCPSRYGSQNRCLCVLSLAKSQSADSSWPSSYSAQPASSLIAGIDLFELTSSAGSFARKKPTACDACALFVRPEPSDQHSFYKKTLLSRRPQSAAQPGDVLPRAIDQIDSSGIDSLVSPHTEQGQVRE
ncbi:unnamed protein product [Heligmosomoides polygyrus]|uniref:Uncharacterized protein n=1 Tax=Heligmosomoides polygyrus TaxID=6339 RepID=A0A183FV21_HELPZ|nr:unnamed protein product [Heligmosomoides polygyrus]